MTRPAQAKVICVCGQEVDFACYLSVNVTINPEMKQEILNREINLFKCGKCGFQQELAVRFLYHDMDNEIMVWVFPESEELSEDMLSTIRANGVSTYTVLGYDGLFELLDRYGIK